MSKFSRGFGGRGLAAIAVLGTAAATALTGCSSSDSAADCSNESSKGEGRGQITYVEGKDPSANGILKNLADEWNKTHVGEEVCIHEQVAEADGQHADFVQHLQTKQSDYDVLSLDVIWTAEFASKEWLLPLEGVDTSALIPSTVDSGTFKGKLWAAPKDTNAALLFYRKDLVPTAPKTFPELLEGCKVATEKKIDCYAGQFKPYEGLTVNVSEFINSAGGSFVGEDGVTPTIDSGAARNGLTALVDAFKSGAISKSNLTYDEGTSSEAFATGKVLFHRDWPFVYNVAKEKGLSADKVGFAPLPGVVGDGTSTLGGHNLAISKFSKHPETAKDFISFVLSEKSQRLIAEGGFAPAFAALYDDAELIKTQPYLPELKLAIERAIPRPKTPNYPAVSKAIQQNATDALSGKKSVDEAIKQMAAGIAQAK